MLTVMLYVNFSQLEDVVLVMHERECEEVDSSRNTKVNIFYIFVCANIEIIS